MGTGVGIAISPGEKVLWSGAPPRGLILRASDTFLVPFSIVWASGASMGVFQMTRKAPATGTPVPFFLLIAVLFTAVAVYITVGRFIVDMWSRARTAYALTDQRVIIASGLLSQTEKSLNLQTLTDVTLTERADGTGTITFGPTSPWGPMSGGLRWPGMPQQPMFERIPGARDVYEVIRVAQTKASRNPA
jgi:hypothetical protein